MRRLLVGFFAAIVIVACGAPSPASGGPETAPDRCTRDDDCVLVVGDPCNPCGACPGQAGSVMSKVELERALQRAYCPARERRDHPQMPPPQCSPCPAPPANAAPMGAPLCSAGVCKLRV